jgi:hypothetical protein
MTALCVRGRVAQSALQWLSAGFLILAVTQAMAEPPISVRLDEARLIKLPDRAATIVIGDPLIADLSIQPGNLAVITGKGYGATNVVILDRGGAVLMERFVEVKGPPDRTVFVYRGVNRNTYSCTPDCAPRITLGDDPDYFDKVIAQATSRNTQAMTAGATNTR